MTETNSGAEILRRTLFNRAHKGGLPLVAAEIGGVGLGALDDFAHGRGNLPPEILVRLAKEIYGANVEYDAERDLLRRVTQPPTQMGVHSEPYDPSGKEPPPRNFGGHSPFSSEKSPPVTKRRLLGWF